MLEPRLHGREPRVLAPLRPTDLPAQSPPELIVGDEQREVAVGGLEQLRRRVERVRAERLPSRACTIVEVGGGLVVQLRQHDVEQRDIDLSALALQHLRDEPERSDNSRRVVDDRVSAQLRGTTRLAGHRRHTGDGLDHVVEGGPLGRRSVQPIAGERDAHDGRVEPPQRLVVEAKLANRRRAKVHKQGLRGGSERTQLGLTVGGGQVDVHAALVAVQAREVHVVAAD